MIASKNILTILSALTFAGCVTSGPLRPDPLAEPLEKAGWTFVDVPRQVLGPGTIVSIRDTDGIRYRGNIEDCVPSEAINIRRELAVGIAGVFEGGRTISA